MKCIKSLLLILFIFSARNIIYAEETFPLNLKNDTSITFVVYTPGGTLDDIKTKPAFFFFEPWGNGDYPVNLYKSLAQKYDFVLIGFNASRNGMEFEISAANFNLTLNELTNRYGLNPSMLCLVGFSGAGKVALKNSSSQSSIPYVIYGGATIDAYLPGKDILGFAGTKDMNYTDLLDYDASLNIKPNVRHFIIEYEGPHAWFDIATMENSFVWMKLNLMRNKVIHTDSYFIHQLMLRYQTKTDSLVAAKQFLAAGSTVDKAMHFLQGLASLEWFSEKQSSLEKNSSYKKEKKEQVVILEQERKIKNDYEKYFFTQDSAWWKAEITRLKSTENILQDASHKRLLGFIGISCYYTATDALEQNNLNVAEKILALYHLAFPQYPEQAFLSAVLWAKKNNAAKSAELLNEAKRLGFTEWDISPDETILQYFIRRPLK